MKINSQYIKSTLIKSLDNVKVFFSTITPNIKKNVLIVIISLVVVGIVNPFGIFDSSEVKKEKKIASNNEKIVRIIAIKNVEITNFEKIISDNMEENKQYTVDVTNLNKSICGLIKQLGNENVEKDKKCEKNEWEDFSKLKTYDVVKDYVEKYIKNNQKKSLAVNENLSVADFIKKNTDKPNVINTPVVINNTNLPEGSKVVNGVVEHKYNGVNDLFYATHINDKCYVSQNEKDHFKSNGRIATDVACNKTKVYVYAPDYKNTAVKYTVKITKNWDAGNSVELYFKSPEDGVEYHWMLGHTASDLKNGTIIKTGDIIGVMDLSGITEGYHVHQELWQGNNNVSYKIINPVLKLRQEKNGK